MHPPFSRGGGGGGEFEPPTRFSKRGGLTGSQFLKVGCLEREGDLKNKLKSELFNNKKSLSTKIFFPDITRT